MPASSLVSILVPMPVLEPGQGVARGKRKRWAGVARGKRKR